MGLTLKLERLAASVTVDPGSRRAPDKNCVTLTLAKTTHTIWIELNRAEAEALADALKKAVAR